MAKSNVFLGLASGKVGDVVFARARGQQITRVRVVPNNPRTARQQAQRVRMAAVAALYRAARAVLKDSFTIRHGFESSYNAFSRNAIGIAPFFTRQMVNACSVLPIPAQASRGALPTLTDSMTVSENGIEGLPTFAHSKDATPAELASYYLRSFSSLNEGDKIVLMLIRFAPNTETGVEGAYTATYQLGEFILDPNSEADWSDLGLQMTEKAILPSGISAETMAASDLVAMSVAIHVRKGADGELQTSSEFFKLNTAAKTLYDSYRTDTALQAAIDSYGSASNSPLSV